MNDTSRVSCQLIGVRLSGWRFVIIASLAFFVSFGVLFGCALMR